MAVRLDYRRSEPAAASSGAPSASSAKIDCWQGRRRLEFTSAFGVLYATGRQGRGSAEQGPMQSAGRILLVEANDIARATLEAAAATVAEVESHRGFETARARL